MKTETVTVGMGATIPHPSQAYANLKASVSYTVRIEDADGSEGWEQAQIKCRSRAEWFLKETLTRMVAECRKRDTVRLQACRDAQDLRNLERENETDVPF